MKQKQTAIISFLNTEFKSINEREIKFSKTLNHEDDFKTILNKMPKFIFDKWESIETDEWSICRHHFIETELDFWQSIEFKN
jgi:hypothetical protein